MDANSQYVRISTPACVEDFSFSACVLLREEAWGDPAGVGVFYCDVED